jgi:hypothetical protein
MGTTDKASDRSRDRSGDNASDVAWIFLAAVLFGVPALIVGGVTTGWADATGWMLDHQVLVPAAADPVLTLPATDGAGLDWPRIALALGAFAVVSLAVRLIAGAIHAAVAHGTYPGRRDR